MDAYSAYRQTQAQTAAPGELVVMLYRGAIRFTVSAMAALEARDHQEAHNNFVRAQAILAELTASLDADRGGEMARNLSSLYNFMHRRLVDANLTKSVDPAREVEQLLRDLLPAWEQIMRNAGAAPRPSMALAA